MTEKYSATEDVSQALNEHVQKQHTDKEPYEFLSAIPMGMFGGINLDPVTYYREESPKPHWHVVTNGFNIAGFELTMRIPGDTKNPHPWPQRVMQDMYVYIVSNNGIFVVNDYMAYTFDTPESVRFTGALFVQDPSLPTYKTESEEVIFLQIYPLTENELEQVKGDDYEAFIERVRTATNGFFIIDWNHAEIT